MIRVEGLTVRYGVRKALDRVDLTVNEGELFGVLGPNGAGKTTLFSVLSGQRKPDAGRAFVGDQDVTKRTRHVQRILGIVPQRFAGYEILSAHENLVFFGSLYGVKGRTLLKRARQLLGMVSLRGRAHEPVSGFSGGMRHRLNIILGLIHQPRVVIMDEPTTGLDPIAREELWAIIRALKERGVTILLTTHYMQEAEALCDRVAILDQGRIRLMGRPRDLGENLDKVFHDCVTSDSGEVRQGSSASASPAPSVSPASSASRATGPEGGAAARGARHFTEPATGEAAP